MIKTNDFFFKCTNKLQALCYLIDSLYFLASKMPFRGHLHKTVFITENLCDFDVYLLDNSVLGAWKHKLLKTGFK